MIGNNKMPCEKCQTPLNCAAFGCRDELRAAQSTPFKGPLPALPEPPDFTMEELEGLLRAAAWLPSVMLACDRALTPMRDLDWEMIRYVYKDDFKPGDLMIGTFKPEKVVDLLLNENKVAAPWGGENAIPKEGFTADMLAKEDLRRSFGQFLTHKAEHVLRLLDFLETRHWSAVSVSVLLRRALAMTGVPKQYVPDVEDQPSQPAGELLAIIHMHRSYLPKLSWEVALRAGMQSGKTLDPRAANVDTEGNPLLVWRYGPMPLRDLPTVARDTLLDVLYRAERETDASLTDERRAEEVRGALATAEADGIVVSEETRSILSSWVAGEVNDDMLICMLGRANSRDF
jgi:hypothetical protein